MSDEQKLVKALEVLGTKDIRCNNASGMWIIEIIAPHLTSENRQEIIDTIYETVKTNFPQQGVIWKLFLYKTEEGRFIINGTLHTVPKKYDHNGVGTIILSASDAYIAITAFDGEVIQMAQASGLQIIARESLNDNQSPILPYKEDVNYLWLEALGGCFGLVKDGLIKKNKNLLITIGHD